MVVVVNYPTYQLIFALRNLFLKLKRCDFLTVHMADNLYFLTVRMADSLEWLTVHIADRLYFLTVHMDDSLECLKVHMAIFWLTACIYNSAYG